MDRMHIEWYLWNFHQSCHCNRNLKINYFSIPIIHNFFFKFSGVKCWLKPFQWIKSIKEEINAMGANPFYCWNYCLTSSVRNTLLLWLQDSSEEILVPLKRRKKLPLMSVGTGVASWCLSLWMLILTLRRNLFTSVLKAELCSIYYTLYAL